MIWKLTRSIPEEQLSAIKEFYQRSCISLGSSMVSSGFLRRLETMINHSSRPILLWIFN